MGDSYFVSFLAESYLSLISKRNSEVSLLTSWVNTLNVENWVLAGRCLLNDILQVVNILHHGLVYILNDEATIDSSSLQCTIVNLQYFKTIVDIQLLFKGILYWTELTTKNPNLTTSYRTKKRCMNMKRICNHYKPIKLLSVNKK